MDKLDGIKQKVVLVCGGPGSGKTRVGKEIARQLKASYFDKDTISNEFTGLLLETLGSTRDDRESDLYLNHAKDIEYQSMLQLAIENLEVTNNSVVCSAPFGGQLNNKNDNTLIELYQLANSMGVEVVLLWIKTTPKLAKQRIIGRNCSRDSWKLNNWDTYLESNPYSVPDTVFDIKYFDNTENKPIEHKVSDFLNSIVR